VKKVLLLTLLALLVAPRGAVADTIGGSGNWVTWGPGNLTSHTLVDVVTKGLSPTGAYYWDNMSWDNWSLGSNIGYCLGTTNCGLSSPPGVMPFYGTNTGGSVSDITFSAGNTSLLTVEMTGAAYWSDNIFGWYYVDINGIHETPLFTGAGPGATTLFAPPTGISYGFYLTSPDAPGSPTWFSDSLRNQSLQLDDYLNQTSRVYIQTNDQHFAIFSPNHSSSSPSYWIGAEDLPFKPYQWSSDRDYNDILVRIDPVPEPGSVYLLGTGLLGLLGLRFRRRKHS
jgi:hypothetical protein